MHMHYEQDKRITHASSIHKSITEKNGKRREIVSKQFMNPVRLEFGSDPLPPQFYFSYPMNLQYFNQPSQFDKKQTAPSVINFHSV